MSKTTLEERIARLEAENRELRSLWIETEGYVIELRSYLNKKIAELDEKKRDKDVKALAKVIMHVHRMSGGVIKSKPAQHGYKGGE